MWASPTSYIIEVFVAVSVVAAGEPINCLCCNGLAGGGYDRFVCIVGMVDDDDVVAIGIGMFIADVVIAFLMLSLLLSLLLLRGLSQSVSLSLWLFFLVRLPLLCILLLLLCKMFIIYNILLLARGYRCICSGLGQQWIPCSRLRSFVQWYRPTALQTMPTNHQKQKARRRSTLPQLENTLTDIGQP
jgi:hypothetical protein